MVVIKTICRRGIEGGWKETNASRGIERQRQSHREGQGIDIERAHIVGMVCLCFLCCCCSCCRLC
jgi:hypothetical protein